MMTQASVAPQRVASQSVVFRDERAAAKGTLNDDVTARAGRGLRS
jgi:hypothetical protein